MNVFPPLEGSTLPRYYLLNRKKVGMNLNAWESVRDHHHNLFSLF